VTTNDNGEGGLPPAGWYPDVGNPARERLWTGERWIEWIRPVKVGRVEADPAGWRPVPGRPGVERLWSGEMWTEETRRVGEAGGSGPSTGVPAPDATPAPGLRPLPAVLYHDERPPERLRTLGILVQVALVAVILAALAGLIADGFYIGVLGDYIRSEPSSVSHTESVVDAVRAIHTIALITYLVTAIAFLFWFYRAYRNLIRTGIRDVRYGTGWAVGGWFIPFFNLVRPKQVANDIWKGSASAGTVGVARWREVPLSSLVNWWWGVWILGWLMVSLGNQAVTKSRTDLFSYSTQSLRDQRTGIWFTEIGLLPLIAAAVLAILLVRQISRMQDDSFKAVPAWDPEVTSPGHPSAATPAATTKTCPECAEEIKAAARVCRYCGYRFSDPV
jgi:Domain of unknown function (DUF4328)/Uncharacterised protein family UPF0547/Protein of unknown function (DUF2510)